LNAAPSEAVSPGGGHGIVGMSERAALYGGSVSAEFVQGRGFVVSAELPAEYLLIEAQPAASK
jgi:signal transduction histidine kinase